MPLRPYQIAAVEAVLSLWREGRRSVLLVAPTGSGKTAMAQDVIRRVLERDMGVVYFVAHQVELLDQPADKLSTSGIPHAFVKAGRPPDATSPVQVCQVQTMVRRDVTAVRRQDGTPYGRAFVVWDECHHIRATTCERVRQALLSVYSHVYFLLLTATPYRRDGRGMADVADALVEATTPRELVDAGYILDPEVWSTPPPQTTGDAPQRKTGDSTDWVQAPKIVGDVVQTWLDRAGGVPTICRAVNRAHSRALRDRFLAAGVRAAHIDGDMPEDARRKLLAGLAIGGRASAHPAAIDVLCTGGTILEEGFDSAASYRHVLADRDMWVHWNRHDSDGGYWRPPKYRPLGCLIDAAPSTSRGAWIQRVGRVTRPWTPADRQQLLDECGAESDLKARAVVLSHAGNLERHGFLIQHEGFTLCGDAAGATKVGTGVARLRFPTPVSCDACLAVWPRGTPTCRSCGADLAPGQADVPAEAPGVLVRRKWDPSMAPPPTLQRQEQRLRALWAQYRAGSAARIAAGGAAWKLGWVGSRFHAEFGFWPPREMDVAIRREFGVR